MYSELIPSTVIGLGRKPEGRVGDGGELVLGRDPAARFGGVLNESASR
jgi:hypothetical protein